MAEKKKPVKKNGYNLLITCDINEEESTKEITKVLNMIGEAPRIKKTLADGVYHVKVSDSRKVNERLKKICEADPKIFSLTHRYTPIDVWCKSDIRTMQQEIKKLASKIEESQKWRISVNKRFWDKMGEKELISKLAEVVTPNSISLENPNKIIQVEIIEKETGISLLDPEDILNISKVKS